jgi:hypothetical protein
MTDFMKYAISLLLLALFLTSCTSSKKMLERGQYDRAIDRSTEKLMKRPNNTKELEVLHEAYELANMFDRERIEFLELEGREESWVEIYQLYEQLNIRQNKVRRLPSQIRNQFTFYNYDREIIDSKAAAADVSYRRGLEFLERGDKFSARQAWLEFETASQIYPGYEDTDLLLEQALQKGSNYALFLVENNSGMILPEFFDSELRKVSLRNRSTQWLTFDTYENEHIEYDYIVVLNINEIQFSPERVEHRTYSESKEIKDGLRYELDRNGNVKKDSLGNDIRVPNIVTVTADITESSQLKTALVSGAIDFFELQTDQLIRTENISVEAVFNNRFGSFSGSEKALSEETVRMIGGRELPFPSNEVMLLDAAELLKERAVAAIIQNRRILEN